jgi:hypothetical protein
MFLFAHTLGNPRAGWNVSLTARQQNASASVRSLSNCSTTSSDDRFAEPKKLPLPYVGRTLHDPCVASCAAEAACSGLRSCILFEFICRSYVPIVAKEGWRAQCVLHYCIKRDETGGLQQQRRRLAARVPLTDPSISLE